jgi:hypothetical protein
VTEQDLDHVKVDAGPDPVRGRSMAQRVRLDGEPAAGREPLEPALHGPVSHRRDQRLLVEVDHDHLSPVLAGQPGPLKLVAPTTVPPSARESGSKCMSALRSPSASPIRRPASRSKITRNWFDTRTRHL